MSEVREQQTSRNTYIRLVTHLPLNLYLFQKVFTFNTYIRDNTVSFSIFLIQICLFLFVCLGSLDKVLFDTEEHTSDEQKIRWVYTKLPWECVIYTNTALCIVTSQHVTFYSLNQTSTMHNRKLLYECHCVSVQIDLVLKTFALTRTVWLICCYFCLGLRNVTSV